MKHKLKISFTGINVLEIGENLLAFEVAHIGFHIFPMGFAIVSGREGDYLLGQTLGVALVSEVIFATDAVGNGDDVGASVFV